MFDLDRIIQNFECLHASSDSGIENSNGGWVKKIFYKSDNHFNEI